MISAKKKRTTSLPTLGASSKAKRETVITILVVIGLAVLVWLSFGESLHNEFVNYDDGDYVYENSVVSQGLTVNGILSAFSRFHAANWHPLTTISHMVDCQLYGLQPWGHHLTNIVLHAAAAILLFLALRRLTTPSVGRPTLNPQLSTLWLCAFVAALFAVHPLRVESVAWISERKDVLSGVFFMLTLWAYAGYARAERRSVGRYFLVVLCFALGLMCKPTLVTLPFVLLLLDYWPLQRMRRAKSEGLSPEVRRLFIEKIPLFALSAISCAVTIVAQRQALEPNVSAGFLQRINNAAVSYVIYLGQLIYPVHLTVSYPYAPIQWDAAMLAITFLAVVTAVFVLVRKSCPFLITGWLWYVGVLVPMIGLVQVGLQPMADRYTYLSQIGLYLIIACSAVVLATRWRVGKPLIAAVALGLIASLVVITRTQAAYWHDSETLWRHAIEITPNNYMAHNDLGTLLLRQQRPEAAVIELQKAIELKPDFENPYVTAGSACMVMGHLDQAIHYYQEALRIHPDSAEDWSNIATAFLKQGKSQEAIEDYRKAVRFKPSSAEMQYNLGHALAASGNWVEAMSCYQAALKMRSGDEKIHNNLGIALVRTGRSDEACDQFREALRINPNYVEAHYNLGCVLAELHRKDDAIAQLNETLRLDPGYENAKERLRELEVQP